MKRNHKFTIPKSHAKLIRHVLKVEKITEQEYFLGLIMADLRRSRANA